MTTKNLMRAIEKSPTLMGISHNGRTHKYYNNKYILEIIDQEGTAVSVNLRNKNEHKDIQSDYFPGSYYHSIKSVVKAFNNFN